MGLSPNAAKCELIVHQGVSVTDQWLQSFQRVEPKDTTLFCAPLFPGSVLDQPYGLRLADEEVRIGVGLRLGLPLCVPHSCHCGSLVDTHGLHSFVCKKALGRPARHQ